MAGRFNPLDPLDLDRIVSGFRIRPVEKALAPLWEVFDLITGRKVGIFPSPLEAERYIRSTVERGIREMAKILPPGFSR